MATPILFNGSDLLFFIGSTPIAMSRSCSISLNASMVDTTTKDSGSWAESIPTSRSWTGSAEGLVVWNDNLSDFTDAFIGKTLLSISFKQRVSATSDIVYNGEAWIESIEVSAEQDAAVTYSVNFTGTGALVKTVTV